MYNKQLDTFLKVAETGSFSKAAQAAYISPAAVIQQINSLEQNLQAVLFERTRHGVTLTEAGEYFRGEAMTFISKDKEIRQKLQSFSPSDTTICVGISLMQKVRLLFDLWVLFDKPDSGYDLRLINADPQDHAAAAADIYEGVYFGYPWQKQRNFLRICSTPFGIGIPRGHALLSKEHLAPEDLRGVTILTPTHTLSLELGTLYQQLLSFGASVREISDYNMSVFWECSCNQYLLAAPLCMQDVISELEIKPCGFLGNAPYGFLTDKHASPLTENFLNFSRGVYDGSIDVGIVPILD